MQKHDKNMRYQNMCRALSSGHFSIVVLSLILMAILSCNSKPSADIEQKWQQSFKVALIEGCSEFKGYFVDSDTAVYIFAYQLPPQMTPKQAFSILREQINTYRKVSETSNELIMQRPSAPQKPELFDEYRFFINERDGKVTVMFASIDSPSEIKNYHFYIKKFQEIHR